MGNWGVGRKVERKESASGLKCSACPTVNPRNGSRRSMRAGEATGRCSYISFPILSYNKSGIRTKHLSRDPGPASAAPLDDSRSESLDKERPHDVSRLLQDHVQRQSSFLTPLGTSVRHRCMPVNWNRSLGAYSGGHVGGRGPSATSAPSGSSDHRVLETPPGKRRDCPWLLLRKAKHEAGWLSFVCLRLSEALVNLHHKLSASEWRCMPHLRNPRMLSFTSTT